MVSNMCTRYKLSVQICCVRTVECSHTATVAVSDCRSCGCHWTCKIKPCTAMWLPNDVEWVESSAIASNHVSKSQDLVKFESSEWFYHGPPHISHNVITPIQSDSILDPMTSTPESGWSCSWKKWISKAIYSILGPVLSFPFNWLWNSVNIVL